jgi:hypothetical protein
LFAAQLCSLVGSGVTSVALADRIDRRRMLWLPM